MSSPRRMLAMLDVFSAEHPVWAIDDIMQALGYARATGYRYIKDLVDAGLLQKVSAGHYALGARIIELDHQLRQTDPLLRAARAPMAALAQDSGFDVVLSVWFAGPKVIDTYRVHGTQALDLSHGRGRPRPLFRSAAPKVLLAQQSRAVWLQLHQAHASDMAAAGLGEDWPAVKQQLSDIRKAGFYVSLGELDAGIGAIAVPVRNEEGDALAALATVGREAAVQAQGTSSLLAALRQTSVAIEQRLKRSP